MQRSSRSPLSHLRPQHQSSSASALGNLGLHILFLATIGDRPRPIQQISYSLTRPQQATEAACWVSQSPEHTETQPFKPMTRANTPYKDAPSVLRRMTHPQVLCQQI